MHAQLYYSDLIQQCPQYPILLPLLSLFIYTTPPRLPPLPLFLLSFALRTHSHPSRTCSTMDIKSDLLSSNRIVSDPRKCCQTNPPESPPLHPPRLLRLPSLHLRSDMPVVTKHPSSTIDSPSICSLELVTFSFQNDTRAVWN